MISPGRANQCSKRCYKEQRRNYTTMSALICLSAHLKEIWSEPRKFLVTSRCVQKSATYLKHPKRADSSRKHRPLIAAKTKELSPVALWNGLWQKKKIVKAQESLHLIKLFIISMKMDQNFYASLLFMLAYLSRFNSGIKGNNRSFFNPRIKVSCGSIFELLSNELIETSLSSWWYISIKVIR